MEIYEHSVIKKWERFKKYPVNYWFKPPPVGLINDVFFKGKYRRLYPLGSEIEFTLNGKITGIDNYTDFEVGYCAEGGPPSFDYVAFINTESLNKYKNRYHPNVYKDYHWKLKRDTMELYPVINIDTDSIGPLSMKLLRISR